MLSPSQSFRIPLARREESFSLSKAPASPPLPPLRKGGKGIARSRRHSIPRNKNTRLETVPPARSTPTLQHAGATVPRKGSGPRLCAQIVATLPVSGYPWPQLSRLFPFFPWKSEIWEELSQELYICI